MVTTVPARFGNSMKPVDRLPVGRPDHEAVTWNGLNAPGADDGVTLSELPLVTTLVCIVYSVVLAPGGLDRVMASTPQTPGVGPATLADAWFEPSPTKDCSCICPFTTL